MASDKKTLELLFESLNMKKVPRAGWKLRRAPHESLADHSFGAALCALALARMERLSKEEEYSLLRRALFHDLHESRIGDLHKIARQYVKSDEKRAEREMLSGTYFEPELSLLQNKRLDLLSHDSDKLDMLLQAIDYANGGNRNMGEFFRSALRQIKSKSGKKLARLALETKLKK